MLRSIPLLLASITVASCILASQRTNIPEAFSAREATGELPAQLQGRGVSRIRAVVLNTSLFSKSGPTRTTSMNFFPGVSLVVSWTSSESVTQPRGVMWKGKVQDWSDGTATLFISGETVTANVTRGDGIVYEIRTTPDGQHWVREIDQKNLPRESEPVNPGKKPK